MSAFDPFAILRSAQGEAIVTPESHPDLFAGSEPVTPAASAPTIAASVPAVAVSEDTVAEAVLALEARLVVLETIAKRNGWNL